MPTREEYYPGYPIYIISKGRYEVRPTSDALERLGVPYRIVVEPQEYEKYAEKIDPAKILVLPFSNHGKGSGPARNWCWDHSISEGHKRHWILDDNIKDFRRLHNNKRYRIATGSFFKICEDFVDRFENVPLAGLQYTFFAPDMVKRPAFALNTRLMSCILIENSCPHRWRGKYNEDVDLSLRVLKDGYCTILFYQFLQDKMGTQTLKGGNTEELYGQGTFAKSKMLVDLHPDCVTLTQKYGRWHHHVDITPFEKNQLILRKDFVMPTGINNHDLALVDKYGTPEQKIIYE